MRLVRLMICACFALVLVSCSLKPGWDVVGKWQREDGKETLEFFRDGKVGLTNANTSMKTTFQMVDPKRIRIDLGSFGAAEMEMAVDKDVLTLSTGPKGKVFKFKKVKEEKATTPKAAEHKPAAAKAEAGKVGEPKAQEQKAKAPQVEPKKAAEQKPAAPKPEQKTDDTHKKS